jgi:ferric-dicitrate binding protein FerR (iron transport regulator)
MALARLPARRRYAVRIFAVMLVISLGLVIASVAYLDRLYTRTMTAELTDSAATLLDGTAGEFETRTTARAGPHFGSPKSMTRCSRSGCGVS